MSALEVFVDRGEIVAGDTITGRVVIHQDFPKCHGIDVAFERVGKRLSAAHVAKGRLHAGPVRAGTVLPFQLTFPMTEPFTHQGIEIDVAWRVWASADVPLALDPKAVAPIVVRPRQVSPDGGAIAHVTNLPPPAGPEPMGTIGQLILWTLFAVLFFCLLPLLPFVLILYARSRLLDTRLSGFEIALPKRRFVLGEWIEPEVRFRLKRPIDVASLKLELHVFERWTTGSGKSRRTHRREVHHEERVVLEDQILGLGEARGATPGGAYRGGGPTVARPEGPVFVWRTPFLLPADGPPSLGSKLNYELKADLDIRGWPDASKQAKVETVAARLTGPMARPEERTHAETSGDVVAVPAGEVRDGVDTDIGGGGVWGWIGVSTLGVGGVAAAVVALGTAPLIPLPPVVFLAIAGLSVAVLFVGLFGFQRAVRS